MWSSNINLYVTTHVSHNVWYNSHSTENWIFLKLHVADTTELYLLPLHFVIIRAAFAEKLKTSK